MDAEELGKLMKPYMQLRRVGRLADLRSGADDAQGVRQGIRNQWRPLPPALAPLPGFGFHRTRGFMNHGVRIRCAIEIHGMRQVGALASDA